MRSFGRSFLVVIGLILLLLAGALPAQETFDLVPSNPPPATWQPADLASLPTDWWQRLDNAQSGSPEERFEQFQAGLREAVGRLDGEQLVAGQTLLQAIRTQFELLRLARAEPEAESFSRP